MYDISEETRQYERRIQELEAEVGVLRSRLNDQRTLEEKGTLQERRMTKEDYLERDTGSFITMRTKGAVAFGLFLVAYIMVSMFHGSGYYSDSVNLIIDFGPLISGCGMLFSGIYAAVGHIGYIIKRNEIRRNL